MIVVVIIKVSSKVAICLYINKMVLTETLAEYKLGVAYSALNIIIVTRTIRLAVKSSQSKVVTR